GTKMRHERSIQEGPPLRAYGPGDVGIRRVGSVHKFGWNTWHRRPPELQRFNQVDVLLHGVLGTGALERNPGVILRATHHVHKPWTRSRHVTGAGLLEQAVHLELHIVTGHLEQIL